LEELHQEMLNLVRGSDAHALMDKPGGVFVRQAVKLPEEDRVLLQAAARVVLAGNRGSLSAQVDRLETLVPLPPALTPSERKRTATEEGRGRETAPQRGETTPQPGTPELQFANGWGGFTPDGREYVIRLRAARATPGAEKASPKGRSSIPALGRGLP